MKLAIAAVTLIVSALSFTACTKNQGLVGDENEVYATVNGHDIKAKDVLERIKNDLADLERNAYDLKKRATEEAINKAILEDEAKKQGMTVEKLMSQFDSLREKDVSKDDINAFLKMRGFDEKKIAKLTKQEKDSIPQIIKMQRVYEARQRMVADLRGKANVKFKIPKPAEKLVEVAVGQGTPVGPASAKVKIVEFSDFQCPFCARARTRLDEIAGKYKDKVVIYFRHFPLESIHPKAFHASEAALCAQDQGKFWAFHNALFDDQSKLDDKDFMARAKELKMDEKAFADCLKSGSKAAIIRKDMEEGMKAGVNSTPTFFINGATVRGAQPIEAFSEIIDEQLGK